MTIPKIQNVLEILEKHFQTKLEKVSAKRVFYSGKLDNQKTIILCSPQSKIHTEGYAWIDITQIQTDLLKEHNYGIFAFRLENGKVYYVLFSDLVKYLTPEALINNKREGDHWKLRIWQDHIQVLGNPNTLQKRSNILPIP